VINNKKRNNTNNNINTHKHEIMACPATIYSMLLLNPKDGILIGSLMDRIIFSNITQWLPSLVAALFFLQVNQRKCKLEAQHCFFIKATVGSELKWTLRKCSIAYWSLLKVNVPCETHRVAKLYRLEKASRAIISILFDLRFLQKREKLAHKAKINSKTTTETRLKLQQQNASYYCMEIDNLNRTCWTTIIDQDAQTLSRYANSGGGRQRYFIWL